MFQQVIRKKIKTDNNDFIKEIKLHYNYIEVKSNRSLSTMNNGGVTTHFIKDDKEIIFGLNEYKKPPTLISPRPNIIIVKDGKEIDEFF